MSAFKSRVGRTFQVTALRKGLPGLSLYAMRENFTVTPNVQVNGRVVLFRASQLNAGLGQLMNGQAR